MMTRPSSKRIRARWREVNLWNESSFKELFWVHQMQFEFKISIRIYLFILGASLFQDRINTGRNNDYKSSSTRHWKNSGANNECNYDYVHTQPFFFELDILNEDQERYWVKVTLKKLQKSCVIGNNDGSFMWITANLIKNFLCDQNHGANSFVDASLVVISW